MIVHFSIGACFPHCDFSQWLKVDDLMEHYALHKEQAREQNKEITLSDFLYSHFVDGDEHEGNHQDQHDDIPLQHLSATGSSYVIAAVEFPFLWEDTLKQKGKMPTDVKAYSFDYFTSHFQPPTV